MNDESIEKRTEVEVGISPGIWQAFADGYRRGLGYPSLWECFKAGFNAAYNAEGEVQTKSQAVKNAAIGAHSSGA